MPSLWRKDSPIPYTMRPSRVKVTDLDFVLFDVNIPECIDMPCTSHTYTLTCDGETIWKRKLNRFLSPWGWPLHGRQLTVVTSLPTTANLSQRSFSLQGDFLSLESNPGDGKSGDRGVWRTRPSDAIMLTHLCADSSGCRTCRCDFCTTLDQSDKIISKAKALQGQSTNQSLSSTRRTLQSSR